jgi:hypothetical protein
MQTQLASLAHTSVVQLRHAIRRVTAAHAAIAQVCDAPLARPAAEASQSTRAAWQDTVIDVRQTGA